MPSVLVDFYHLTRDPAGVVAPRIAERVLADGGRLLVTHDDEAALAKLDRQLWDASPSSFLPHGREGSADDKRQPILLSTGVVAANGARNLLIADGRWREAGGSFERVFYLFDRDALAGARDAWRALSKRPDAQCRYWKQDGGRWVQGP